jgi:RNA polymerase sigma-70 factor (ECF subfamily)
MLELEGHTRRRDAGVVDRAKRGEASACREIVHMHERRVFAQLRGMLVPARRAHLVEDLAQETFLRAFRGLDGFTGDPQRALGAWLVTIATRVALNELRRHSPQTRELDTVSEAIATGRGDPSIDGRVIGRGIEGAVRELPAGHRAAFLLRELHGFEYADIARVLEIDLGTVKSRLSRARARLRKALSHADETRKEGHDGA